MTKGYYGSTTTRKKTGKGGTPDQLLAELHDEFGPLFDPCPDGWTECGLAMDWKERAGHLTVYCNPPYSRGQLAQWVKKCHDEWRRGVQVVLLIPSYTDTAYFHDWIYPFAELRFLRGRLRFKGYNDQASFPSMLCIFTGDRCY